jgi:pimeloyl-ACP methyl ester carboxylesterase
MKLVLHDVQGHRLAARRGGPASGRPIVFLHGILAGLDAWLPTLPPQIRHGRQWILLSLPGHYPAQFPRDFDARGDISRMFAGILSEALDRLVGRRPVELVGWSTGGFAALSLARHFPEQVAGVMSISGFASGRWHGPMGALQKLAACGPAGRLACKHIVRLIASRPRWYLKTTHGMMYPSVFGRADRMSRKTMARLRVALQRHELSPLLRLIQHFRECDITPQLGDLRTATLIVGGLRDPLIRASQTKQLAAAIPGAALEIVEDVGHFLFLENTRRYWRLLLDWMARDTARTTSIRRAGAAARAA